MYYFDKQKASILNLLNRVIPHYNARELREQLAGQPLDTLRQIARNNLERVVSIQLMDLGLQPHMNGYAYCREAICQALTSGAPLGNLTQDCYAKIAAEFEKSIESVERAMRLAIRNAWEHHSQLRETLQTQFCPTNREFIAKVAELIRVQYL